MVYVMAGYFLKIYWNDMDWIYLFEQDLFAIAYSDVGIGHWTHVGGFIIFI